MTLGATANNILSLRAGERVGKAVATPNDAMDI